MQVVSSTPDDPKGLLRMADNPQVAAAALRPLLPLPIAPRDFNTRILTPALALLPTAMDSRDARVQLTATALQESKLAHRWQVVDPRQPQRKGPARGLLQFERGTRASRGGVWGVYLHDASRYWLPLLCRARGVEHAPTAIWQALEVDDILAAGVARLLLFTDPRRLPDAGDTEGGWKLYLRTWRPGAYTNGTAAKRRQLREEWASHHPAAQAAVP